MSGQSENGVSPGSFDSDTLPPLPLHTSAGKRAEGSGEGGSATENDGATLAKGAQVTRTGAPCTEHPLSPRREALLDHVRRFLFEVENDLSAAWERNDVAAATQAGDDAEWATDLLGFAKGEGRG